MKKYLQDYGALALICIMIGFLEAAFRDWSGLDLRFGFGILAGGVYYDWYKKS